MMPETCWVNLNMNKHLYLCHLLVLSSPTLMMHDHMNLKLYVRFTYKISVSGIQFMLHRRIIRLLFNLPDLSGHSLSLSHGSSCIFNISPLIYFVFFTWYSFGCRNCYNILPVSSRSIAVAAFASSNVKSLSSLQARRWQQFSLRSLRVQKERCFLPGFARLSFW